MTRDEVLALYRPIRASVRGILSAAVPVCNHTDLARAAKQLDLWAEGKIILPEGDKAAEMLSDIALFEPNQRGRRAFDHFLSDATRRLDAADFELAERMGKAFFSLFHLVARHGTAGVWLEDLLDGGRSLWLMDESMETSAPIGLIFGARLFGAGEFHVGFGIVAQPDEETTQFAVQARRYGNRLPFRQSLAATVYGDSLRERFLISPELEDAFTTVLAEGLESSAGSRRKRSARPEARKVKPRGAN
jgi:hypothetical protein